MTIQWMNPVGLIGGIVAIVFGILVLVFPRSLNIVVGVYLLLAGIGLILMGGRVALPIGIVTVLLGVFILIFPTVLNYLVGVYLHEISRTPLLDAAAEVDLSKVPGTDTWTVTADNRSGADQWLMSLAICMNVAMM